MKIYFSIEHQDNKEFLNALEYAAANSPQKDSLGFLQDIIKQVKLETIIPGIVFVNLKKALERYTDGNPVLINSVFRTGFKRVGYSCSDFINDDRGLIAVLNNVLKSMQEEYKPGSNVNLINKSRLDYARTIDDLVNIIISNYAKS